MTRPASGSPSLKPKDYGATATSTPSNLDPRSSRAAGLAPATGDPEDVVEQRERDEGRPAHDGASESSRRELIDDELNEARFAATTRLDTASRWTKAVLQFLLDQWFVLGVGFVIGMAAAFPNVARTGGIIKAQYTIKYLFVAIIFFISGLTLSLRNLFLRARDWKLHVVSQGTCFLVFPTIVFAIINLVRAGDPKFERFKPQALIGMQVMSVVPTTVSSNVVMTGQAGGDEAATTIEVVLGNLVGTFLSPALLEMYFASSRWEFGRPDAGGGGGIGEVYRQVMQQLGYTVFIPLFIGELIQWRWPRETKLVRTKLRLGKVGSLCLLGVVWSTFSTAFYENAFEILSGQAIAFIVLVNIALYVVLSGILFLFARHIPFPYSYTTEDGVTKTARGPLFDPETTISLLFVGAAKGAALGAPIVAILYSGLAPQDGAVISLPIVLYQGTQIVLGQVTVAILKAWHRRVTAKKNTTA
ncbi:hypothetical protein JCM11491_001163 [Sporobolomyces phaffii]